MRRLSGWRRSAASVASILLFLAAAPAVPVEEHCISQVCLGMRESVVLQRLGSGYSDPLEKPPRHCYRSFDSRVHLTVNFDREDPAGKVKSVLATTIPSCPRAEIGSLGGAISTCHGVKLKQSRAELDRSLGALLQRGARRYPWATPPEEVEEYHLKCDPKSECSLMASVYLSGDRVVGVSLWYPDC